MASRQPPKGFVAALQRRYGSQYDCTWNDVVMRWQFKLPTAIGGFVYQWFGWRVNPLTGEPCEPDANGLLPFRDLDPEGIKALFQSMDETYLANPHDGAGTWAKQVARSVKHNEDLSATYRRQDAVNYAEALSEMDIRRPWIKHHSKRTSERRIAYGLVKPNGGRKTA